jgi:hypothetical protein
LGAQIITFKGLENTHFCYRHKGKDEENNDNDDNIDKGKHK